MSTKEFCLSYRASGLSEIIQLKSLCYDVEQFIREEFFKDYVILWYS